MSDEPSLLEKTLTNLAECELEMDEVEKEVERYRLKKTQPILDKRSVLLSEIPSFWYIVLAEHEDFQEYIQTEDMKFLEFIKQIHVQFMADESGNASDDPTKFSITFKFEAPNNEIEAQTVTKYFERVNDPESGEEKVISKKTSIKWPAELDSVNPELIKQKKGKLTPEDKKNYRIGMKSFFAFFAWTGLKPGKEYRYGEDLALLITEDIFPHATKYYTEAAPGLGGPSDGEEDVGTSSEELDLGDEEEEEEGDGEPPAKKVKTV